MANRDVTNDAANPDSTGITATTKLMVIQGSALKEITYPNLISKIFDTSLDNAYVIAVSELTADRTVTLPLLTGNDTFVFQSHTQTLTNKTLTTPTISSFVNATHNHTTSATGGTIPGITNIVLKTADETVNNSTTLQNDDHLLFSAAANKVYRFELYLIIQSVTGAASDDIKFGWSAPVSCTAYWGSAGITQATSDGLAPIATASAAVANQGISATPSYGITGAITVATKFEGIIINGANAGTVNFQWAQAVAGARDLKILTNSVLLYTLLN